MHEHKDTMMCAQSISDLNACWYMMYSVMIYTAKIKS